MSNSPRVTASLRTGSSFLLNFAYAEVLESNKSFEDVHSTFDKFLGVLRKDLDALEARVNSGNASCRFMFSQIENKRRYEL